MEFPKWTSALLVGLRSIFTASSLPSREDEFSSVINLDIIRKRDNDRNRDSSLPDGEHLEIHCVWGIEYYVPEHFERLIEAFEQLGWAERDPSDATSWNPDPITWIRNAQRHRRGGAWISLGELVAPGESRPFASPCHEVPLPEYFRYARAHLHSMSTSLIAVRICFALTEDHSTRFNSILNSIRSSYTTKIGQREQIHFPDQQKTDAIKQFRETLADSVALWFSKNLPGAFASGNFTRPMPTCELITTRTATPLEPDSDQSPATYLRLAELDRGFDVWVSTDNWGLHFRTDTSTRQHVILAAREQDLDSDAASHEELDSHRRVYMVDTFAIDVFVCWALIIFLDTYRSYIVESRNRLLSHVRSRKRALKSLKLLEEGVLAGVDVAAIAAEISNRASAGQWFGESAENFRFLLPLPRISEESFAQRFRAIIEEQSNWLEKIEVAAREQAMQIGSLLGARENVRLQYWIRGLTVVVLISTLVTVGVSICS